MYGSNLPLCCAPRLAPREGVLLGALVAGKGKVNEADLFQRMHRRIADTGASARPDAEADKGFAALGAPADTIIRRAYAFQRGVAAVFASKPPRTARTARCPTVDRISVDDETIGSRR